MSIKDILLYLDDSSSCERRLDVALGIAQTQEARVNALSIAAYDYYQSHHLHAGERMAAAEALLERKAREADVNASFRCIESAIVGVSTAELLTNASHCSDLIVVGQESYLENTAALIEPLVTRCGRPVLVVPVAGACAAVGTRVLVAWKNGREAARALHDAIPILRLAKQVTLLVVAVDEEPDPYRWEGVLEHLQCHGIRPRTELQPPTSATLAESLLNHSCEGGYDLLVMGAGQPGGGRSAELGTPAGQILREMTIPVFMSH